MPNFIKRKHAKKGKEKKNNKQRPKFKQTSSPNEAGHKEKREPLRVETFIRHEAYQLKERVGKLNKTPSLD